MFSKILLNIWICVRVDPNLSEILENKEIGCENSKRFKLNVPIL